VIVIFVMVGLIQGALGLLFTGIAAVVPGLSDDLRAGLVLTVATLVNALVGAITPIAITMLYLDLRVRKEGLDLDQLARQAAPGPAPASTVAPGSVGADPAAGRCGAAGRVRRTLRFGGPRGRLHRRR